jgi:hypothetical protein
MAGRITDSIYRVAGYKAPASSGRLGAGAPWRFFHASTMGTYRISGTVQRLNPPLAPTQRMVVLFDRANMMPVRSMISNADGSYAFELLAMRKYLVMALDEPNGLNAAVADHQLPGIA